MEQASAHIRRLILSGELVKGDRLLQDEIAEELGVSRIPIREALITLDREGWLNFEPNRGAFVAGIAADDIRDHYELRGLVFGLIARRVVASAAEGDLATFVALHKAMRTAADIDEFAEANDRFIGRLLKVAASPRLTAALLATPSLIPSGFFEFVPTGRAIQEAGYAAFIAALKKSSEDKADIALVNTLRRQGEAVVAAFTATGLVVDG